MRWRVVIAITALPIVSCAGPITVPVAVVSAGVPGGIMRGTNTASFSEASFNVSSGTFSCGGSYNPLDTSLTISIAVLCNDGRKGIVTATRDRTGMSGGGHFTLTDGTTGDFIFGEAAGKL